MVYDHNEEEAEAANLLALARQTHDAHVAAAKVKAEKIVDGAEAQARELLDKAREELSWLEEKLEKHRDLEANYRAALKGYLSDLLAELSDDDEFIAPDSVDSIHVPELQIPEEFENTREETEEEVAEGQLQAEAVAEDNVATEEEHGSESSEAAHDDEEHFAESETSTVETWEDEGGSESPEVLEEVAEEIAIAEEAYELPSSDESDEFEEAEDDPSDDLPPVPDFIESSVAHEEIAGIGSEDDDDIDEESSEFDALIAGEPKPATDAISLEEEPEQKGSRGFFGLGKH